jgi:hypothetical protein
MNTLNAWRKANVTLSSIDKLLLALSAHHSWSLSGFLACGEVGDDSDVAPVTALQLVVPVLINGLERPYRVSALATTDRGRHIVLRSLYRPQNDAYYGGEDDSASLFNEIVVDVTTIDNKQRLVPRSKIRTRRESDLEVPGPVTVSTELTVSEE